MNNKLRNWLVGAGIAAAGAIGTKKAVDYLRNRGQEDKVDESQGDQEATSAEEVAYAVVEPDSVQSFLDKSFKAGRYTPNRPPKVFEYQDTNYMVVWAKDNEKNKNQMLAFKYTDAGRQMIASVGYNAQETDYNLDKLAGTPFAVEINDKKFTSGQGKTNGSSDVDLVIA